MFFWIGVVVVLVVVVALISFGLRGISGRAHKPGTTRLD
jgi:hypothetical protein